jgi:hypothetical protein
LKGLKRLSGCHSGEIHLTALGGRRAILENLKSGGRTVESVHATPCRIAQESSGHHTRSESGWRLSTEQDHVDDRSTQGMLVYPRIASTDSNTLIGKICFPSLARGA